MEIKEAHAAHIAVMYYSRNVPVPEQMEALFPDFHESWKKEQGQRLRDNYMEFFAMLDGPTQHKYIFNAMDRYAEEAAGVADIAEGKLMEEMLAEVREEIKKENA